MSIFYFPQVQILTFLCTQFVLSYHCYQFKLVIPVQFYTTGRGGGERVCVSITTSAILSLCFMFLFVDL